MADLIGKSLGRYQIIEKLGEGGMAIVYKAYDTHLESEVAVKFIRMERLAPESAEKTLKRFEREAKALAKLSHPNIVKVIDYGEFEGQPYLVMPYLSGGTLKQMLKGTPMDSSKAARLLTPIAEALAYAHKQGILHRDIKSSNILITDSGAPMLADFGVAKLFEAEETVDLTGTGIGVGTPEYMAPEQGRGKTDQRSEVYSLGIVFYELVTGRKPYTAETPLAVLIMQASDPLQPPRKFVPGLPANVEGIIFKCLAKAPESRYQTMGELAEALGRIIAGNKRSISIRWVRTSEALVVAAILLALVIGSMIIVPKWLHMGEAAATVDPTSTATRTPNSASTQETVQTAEEDTQGEMYDDFQSSQNNGSWNKALWVYSDELSNSTRLVQDGGVLTLSDLEPTSGEGVLLPLSGWHANTFRFFEVKVKVPDQSVDNANITLTVITPSVPPGWTEMGIYFNSAGARVAVGAENKWLAEKEIKTDTWYTLRIEFDAQSNVIRYLLDGETLATYELSKAAVRLQPHIQLWHSRGDSFTAVIDDVMISQ
jgi:serine/threonine protein kinase